MLYLMGYGSVRIMIAGKFLSVFSGDGFLKVVYSQVKFRREECIGLLRAVRLKLFSAAGENRQTLDSNGYRVYVGNFDSDGLNVNNDHPSNSNSNLWVCVARNFHCLLSDLPS